jgi:ABC-2 type transport system permease protein
MLIGACTFSVVTVMMWDVGFWIRDEQLTGTLESLYLAPSKRVYLVTGITLFSITESIIFFFASLGLGCLMFQINPFAEGSLIIALLFLLVGMIPLWGLAFLFGSLILKIKEANSLINLMQWVVTFFMGAFYPVTMLPRYLKYIALAFPPTWMTNGLRASLLDLSYFFQGWYLDLAILAAFCFVTPLIGYFIFTRTENKIRKTEGVGHY